jgi:hypothetical protein
MLNSITLNNKYFLLPDIKEIIATSVFPAFKEIGKLELKEVLLGIKEHNDPEIYKNTIRRIYSIFSLLQSMAMISRTIVEGGLVELILSTVRECAETDNIILH